MKSKSDLSAFFGTKKVLVTGGSSGIGKALSHRLLLHGADVTIVSDRADRLQLVLREFKAEDLNASGILCDLAERENIARLVDRLRRDNSIPDIIINNAGFAVYRTFEQSLPEEIERLMEVNLLAAMRLTRWLLPEFIQRRSGSVVNMASIAGTMAITPNATYCAAKHAMVAWSECLRYELARFNVRVNVICPGRVLTPFFDHETFRRRATRPETDYTLSLPVVVDGTLGAIMKNRFITYLPRTLGILSRLKAALPFIIDPFYERLMVSRIDSIYNNEEK